MKLLKQKMILVKFQGKKNFIKRLKYAEHNIFCICIDVYRIYEVDDKDKLFEVLSKLNIKN